MTNPATEFHLTITALSPVHIAAGSELVEGFDFVCDTKKQIAYIVNDEAALLLAEQKLDRRKEQIKRKISEFAAKPARQQTEQEERKIRSEADEEKQLRKDLFRSLTLDDLMSERRRLLSPRDLEENPEIAGQQLVRYALRGALSDGNRINEHIKDAFGRAYIPGSSLKGAIRTALGWQELGAQKLAVERPERDKKKADDRYEHMLFTADKHASDRINDVNLDVFRALRVGDSTPLADALFLAPLRIQKQSRQGGPDFDVLNVEAIQEGSQFQANIHLDEYMLGPEPEKERGLNYAAKGTVLRQFAAACKARGEQLLREEMAFARERKLDSLVRFYDGLIKDAQALGPTSFMLQLGWGAGWNSKTYGSRLRADAPQFAAIVNEYKLQPQRKSLFAEGDLFPATRKLVLKGDIPMFPLGWVRVDVEEVTR